MAQSNQPNPYRQSTAFHQSPMTSFTIPLILLISCILLAPSSSQIPGCDSNCLTCTSIPTDCFTCHPGMYLDYGDSTCDNCVDIFPSCTSCDDQKCLTCISGYAFPIATPTICAPCSNLLNCLTCTNGLFCSQCSSGLVTDILTLNGTCVTCAIPNCISCKNGPQCINCAINFVLNATTRLNGCITCPAGSYASSTVKCSPCPPECSSCSNSVNGLICASCNPIAIHNSTSQKCMRCDLLMNYCSQCSNPTTCDSCQFPYKLGTTQTCDHCESGFININGFCTKSSGCQIYLPNESRCLTCFSQNNFYYDTINKTCKCKTGFYESNTTGLTQCLSKCGDGILIFGDEICDDGNLRNGDGCSDNCLQESGFTCLPGSPSLCTLQYSAIKFQYNYAYRYEGQNKCRFSLSFYPSHPGLKYIDWPKYLTFNISEQFIVNNSKIFTYIPKSNEITIDLEYLSTIQAQTIEFKLFVDSPIVAMEKSQLSTLQNSDSSESPQSVGQGSTTSPLLQSSKQMKIIVEITGVNSKLIYESESLLKMYKGACIGSWIITILILVQFVVGSYFHKMIGLQTIQILQFFYFVRIIIEQRLSTFLNSMNIFKYTAYGGYSNYEAFYGQETEQVQSLTYTTVNDSFVIVGLLKYFTLNTNITLALPLLALLGFLFTMCRKYNKRNQYMKKLEQSVKDQYTILRRSSQWVYDHFVFPYVNIFNMIVIFSTILYLQSQSTSSSSTELESTSVMKLIEQTSFSTHLAIAFLTFSIYCFEVFQSYEELKHSRLTDEEKARVPKSIYEQLQHDENNPDRPNYKPGYVLFYLVFYFLVELILMLDTLLESLKNFGVEIMLLLSFLYLYFVWKWKPYNEAVNFHNKALRFNHFTVFFFMAISVLSKRLELNSTFFVILICLVLAMLTIVSIFGFVRIVIEFKFRKRLLDDSNLMNGRKGRPSNRLNPDESADKKNALLGHNRFVFENQVRAWLKQNKNLDIANLSSEEIELVKVQIRKQFYLAKRQQKINDSRKDLPEDLFAFQNHVKKELKKEKLSDSREITKAPQSKKQTTSKDPENRYKKPGNVHKNVKEKLQFVQKGQSSKR